MPNYPTSLDTLTNPTSSDGLASPPHATQHTDANDIVEALEAKVGIGASTPTTTGHVLTVTGAGATAYQAASSVTPEGRPSGGGLVSATIPGAEAISVTTLVLTANRTYYFPWYVATSITLDRLLCETTAGAGTVLRLGIYNADTSWQPTTLVLDAGTVDPSTVAVKSITINQTLAAGRYLAAANCDGAPTLRVLRGGSRYGGIDTSFGTLPFYQSLFIAATISSFPATGTVWTGTGGTSTPFNHFMFARLSTP